VKWLKIFSSSNRLLVQIIFPTTILFLTWFSQMNSFAYVWMRKKVGFLCATWSHYLGLSCLRRKKRLSQFSWGEGKLGPHFLEDLGYISMKKLSKEISSV
jgi:hypothetical protein